MLASDQPYPNQGKSKAKIPGIDRLRELGGSIDKNNEPVTHLLLSKHRAFSAYDSARTGSASGKRIQTIQGYR